MTDQKIPIFIAGATGFCGQGVVEALSQNPAFRVIAHIRKGSSRLESASKKFESYGAEVLCCDFSELPEKLAELQPKVFASFIGTTKAQMRKYGGSYQSIDYQLNHDLLELAKKGDNAPLFFYLSSMGAEWGKWNAYLKARLLIEQELQASSLSYVVMRPGILSGESRDQDRLGEELGAWFSHKMAGFYQTIGLQGRADATKPLDAPDVGRFVRHVLEIQLLENKDAAQARTQKIYELPEIHRVLREG